ncbi:metallophosphoesterase [Methylomonas sp. AM2-LC]|uniref:metallophosphoesterase n=1 Tax=Methylomonas sp. AM2-LC TaxID=3153301 RepID=UPI003266F11A
MLKILQISDLHILPDAADTLLGVNTEFYFQQVIQQAHATHVKFDLILVTGDLAQHPCSESYMRILHILNSYHTPTLCLPGNHDDFALMESLLNTEWVSCHPHFILENWQIISLQSQKPGSAVGEISPTQLQFLSDCLLDYPDTPTLLTMHHHCISSESSWMDTMQIVNSDTLLDCISASAQVKIVTYGHIHQETNRYQHGIGFFSAPASCFQFTPRSTCFGVTQQPPGYRVFELKDDGSYQTQCYWLAAAPAGLNPDLKSY